jgi:hypothetical protein
MLQSKLFIIWNQDFMQTDARVEGSNPFKAETTGRAHTEAGLGLHLYGRCGSAIYPSDYAASRKRCPEPTFRISV